MSEGTNEEHGEANVNDRVAVATINVDNLFLWLWVRLVETMVDQIILMDVARSPENFILKCDRYLSR